MATANDIIDSARYDLQDYQEGIRWDNAELLNYLNRMIDVMDSTLASMKSDLLYESEADIDCVADQNYVDISNLNSGLWQDVTRVWIGQNLLEQTSVSAIRYKRIFRSDSGQPYYWALKDQTIIFEMDCDDDYSNLIIEYLRKSAVLTLTDSMPYNGLFNETFRDMLVFYAQSKKEGSPSAAGMRMSSAFHQKAMEEVVRRNFFPRPYYIDF